MCVFDFVFFFHFFFSSDNVLITSNLSSARLSHVEPVKSRKRLARDVFHTVVGLEFVTSPTQTTGNTIAALTAGRVSATFKR